LGFEQHTIGFHEEKYGDFTKKQLASCPSLSSNMASWEIVKSVNKWMFQSVLVGKLMELHLSGDFFSMPGLITGG